MSAGDYYSGRVKVFQDAIKRLDRVFFRLFWFRLGTFLGFIMFLVAYTVWPDLTMFLALSVLSFITFIIIVQVDVRLLRKQKLIKNKQAINQKELNYLNHQYTQYEDGALFEEINPLLAGDFDLFGKNSLYQYLNRAVTAKGKYKMANSLCSWSREKDFILQKQEAIKELGGKCDFLEDFQANGMLNQETGDEHERLLRWLSDPESGMEKMKWLLVFYPLLLICWIALVAFSVISSASLFFMLFFAYYLLNKKRRQVNLAHNNLGRNAKIFKMYESLLVLIEKEEFQSFFLQKEQQKLSQGNASASQTLRKFFVMLERFDYRYNMVAGTIFNVLFLFDLQMLYRLDKWKMAHKELVPAWLETLSTIDSMTGYARYAFNNKDAVSYPELSKDEFCFMSQEMGHPLIKPEERVCNDFSFKRRPRVIVVTGANMAGKSTFLRTLIVNIILGINGAPVCAKYICFTPCDIMSSINIRDSLSHKASYFYAELLRIRQILDFVEKQPDTFVVLDEILRGTNTKDKQAGSLGLLEKLISLNAVVVIATHDLSIGKMEEKYPEAVINRCFEVELNGDELVFDYKLKQGVSKKLNASFLMRKMGVI